MKILKLLTILALFLLLTTTVQARTLDDCSRLELRSGVWSSGSNNGVTVGITGATITTSTSGGLGMLSYSRWYEEHLAFGISIGGLVAETTVEVDGIGLSTSTQQTIVTPILIGLRYYFLKSSFNSSMRPFVTAKLGTYIGHIVETETSLSVTVREQTELAMGAFWGGGVDFRLSRKFMLGINMGYHAVMDFSEMIGNRKNYSGAEISFGLSLLFGGK